MLVIHAVAPMAISTPSITNAPRSLPPMVAAMPKRNSATANSVSTVTYVADFLFQASLISDAASRRCCQ